MNLKSLSVLNVLTLLPVGYIAAQQQPSAAESSGQRPNILFILSDDHTSQAWGIYGGVLADYAKNDNIKRLASEGVVLDNCFVLTLFRLPAGQVF